MKTQTDHAFRYLEQFDVATVRSKMWLNFLQRLRNSCLQWQWMQSIQHQQIADYFISTELIEDRISVFSLRSDNLHQTIESLAVEIH